MSWGMAWRGRGAMHSIVWLYAYYTLMGVAGRGGALRYIYA